MAQLHRRQSFHGNGETITVFIFATPTPTLRRTQATNPPNENYNTNPTSQDDDNGYWGGTKIAASIVPIAFIALLIFGSWYYCCGGRRHRQQRRAARSLPGPVQPLQNRDIELTPVPPAHLAGNDNGDLSPPQYAEVLPPRHQTIAGGVTHVREEEEGVISDGKTPLSEIPFEDVVVSSASSLGSGSSAREFGHVHRGGGGNTHGHTNS